jgi:hypothetical protein
MAIRFLQIDSALPRAAVVAAFVVCLTTTFFFVKWCLANAISVQAEYKEIAELAAGLAPSDPQPHFRPPRCSKKLFCPTIWRNRSPNTKKRPRFRRIIIYSGWL